MIGDSRRLEIWRAHRVRLIDSVTQMVGDRSTAEDVVQEAWLRFSRPQNGKADQVQPVGYLYRIVRNLAIDLTRRRKVESVVVSVDPPVVEQVADFSPSPEQSAVSRDELAHVRAILDTLPGRTRVAFEMYNFGSYTFQQIADHLHISVGMAHHLVKQAVACCMDAIAETDE